MFSLPTFSLYSVGKQKRSAREFCSPKFRMLRKTLKGLRITEQQAQIGSACGGERLSPMAGGQMEQDTLELVEHLAPMAGGEEQLPHITMAG